MRSPARVCSRSAAGASRARPSELGPSGDDDGAAGRCWRLKAGGFVVASDDTLPDVSQVRPRPRFLSGFEPVDSDFYIISFRVTGSPSDHTRVLDAKANYGWKRGSEYDEEGGYRSLAPASTSGFECAVSFTLAGKDTDIVRT